MLSRNIHLKCTDIKIQQNYQEGIPLLLEAARDVIEPTFLVPEKRISDLPPD
jgi:hypothetical protein